MRALLNHLLRLLAALAALALAVVGLRPLLTPLDPEAPIVSHLLTRAAFPEDLRGIEAVRYAFPFLLGLILLVGTLWRWRRPESGPHVALRLLHLWLAAGGVLAAVKAVRDLAGIEISGLGGRWYWIHNDLFAAGTLLSILTVIAILVRLFRVRRSKADPRAGLPRAQRLASVLCALWILHGLLQHLYSAALDDLDEIGGASLWGWVGETGRGYWTCLASCAMIWVGGWERWQAWTSTPEPGGA